MTIIRTRRLASALAVSRRAQKLRAQYAARNERKEALWHEEELIWMQVAEQTLMVPEIEVRSKRLAQRYSHLISGLRSCKNGRLLPPKSSLTSVKS